MGPDDEAATDGPVAEGGDRGTVPSTSGGDGGRTGDTDIRTGKPGEVQTKQPVPDEKHAGDAATGTGEGMVREGA